MSKTRSLKIRFEEQTYDKLERHAKVRGVPLAVVVRELVNALPDNTESVPIAKVIYEVKL
jgi:hypothetical protein